MAAARQNEMKVSMAVVATMTRGTVMSGGVSEFWPTGLEDMRRKENIKILLWHLYAPSSTKRKGSFFGGNFVNWLLVLPALHELRNPGDRFADRLEIVSRVVFEAR
jgi:hypothetical protein